MLGVAARPDQWEAVHEFFELFKTPWERATSGRSYRALVSTVGQPWGVDAEVLVAYASSGATTWSTPHRALLPMYCSAEPSSEVDASLARDGCSVAMERVAGQVRCRFGYDLFDEVRHLLTKGQPPAHALIPTLDLHIALLKDTLVKAGVSFVEVPARPAGYDFVCCLTHDLDFFGIARHRCDRTIAGFMARASLGSLVEFAQGRRTLDEVRRNWAAVLAWPLVLLGARSDFWQPIADYERADGARPSTFFVVPFRDRPGISPDGGVAAARAVRYQAREVAEHLRGAVARGCEVAVHGLDAWRDAEAGRAEMAEVAPWAGRDRPGVRMHWLYFSADAPSRLEAAGFDYDATCGFNDAVGYRAGTSQAFRLPGTTLMELPLSIMDTALFFADRMNLSCQDALARCRTIVDHARRAGGTVVVNWHDRSLAPERQWGRAYRGLLQYLDASNPWFATASHAVQWYRWRRSVTFTRDQAGRVGVTSAPLPAGLPGATLTSYGPQAPIGAHPLNGSDALSVRL